MISQLHRALVSVYLGLVSIGTAFGQQNIWSQTPHPSPIVHKNQSVTFQLYAPKAKQVEISGDFLPEQSIETPNGRINVTGRTSLKPMGDGLWQLTTAPLQPELYQYSLYVDSLQISDPSNVYRHRDTNLVTDVFLVGGGVDGAYGTQRVAHGSVLKQWVPSATLHASRRLSIYLPPNYFEQSSKRFPVLYLLHGMGGDEEAWLSMGRAAQIFDNLIAAGRMKPTIVVMPNGNVAQEAAPGEGSEGMVTPNAYLPRTMNGEFEAAFPDIVHYVDTHFRTLRQKDKRAIAGLSMGGFHSLHIAANHPKLFGYIGLFSAATRPMVETKSPIYDDYLGKLHRQFVEKPRLYYIAIGREDFLYEQNQQFRSQLQADKLPHEYHETEGGHTWRNWRRYLLDFLPKLF
ncbi:MAG: esterase [Bacteroidaceae bacterium]|nr:esterase [Bacteroidaceae bacterium]